jgi:small subunit ribosomal protein S16
MGRRKVPVYSIVATDQRNARDGRYIEDLGRYYPLEQPARVRIEEDRVRYWLEQGAQPSDTVRSILSKRGLLLATHLKKKGASEPQIEEAVTEHREQWEEKGEEFKLTAEARRQKALEAERQRVKELEEEEARLRAEEEQRKKEKAEKEKAEAEAAEAAEEDEAEAATDEAETAATEEAEGAADTETAEAEEPDESAEAEAATDVAEDTTDEEEPDDADEAVADAEEADEDTDEADDEEEK